ncbi:MAG: CoA transferase [Acidobacteria bacterium]|nr:CoA transferase [Acidobacteriota bacterium]
MTRRRGPRDATSAGRSRQRKPAPASDRALTAGDFGPLSGTLVLDVSRTLAGPFCTMLLGDMGATVVKIEQPGNGDPARGWPPFVDGHSTYFLSINRNKRSVTLDIHHPDGQQLLKRLVARADVFVENFKVGSLARSGLDFAALRKVNRRLIYCAISGYGQTGPRRCEAGFDLTIQAESGIMSVTGDPDGGPTKAGVPLADMTAGLYGAYGTLAALRARDLSGEGQLVDVALLDSALSLLAFHASSVLAGTGSPKRLGNMHPSLAPYEVFEASAASRFALGVGTDALWRRLCDALKPSGFEPHADFATNAGRVAERERLHAALEALFSSKSAKHWVSLLKRAGIPCSGIHTVEDAIRAERASERSMVVEAPHQTLGATRQVGIPVKLSETPGSVRRGPPELGAHTDEVYREWLGLSAAELKDLRKRQVI